MIIKEVVFFDLDTSSEQQVIEYQTQKSVLLPPVLCEQISDYDSESDEKVKPQQLIHKKKPQLPIKRMKKSKKLKPKKRVIRSYSPDYTMCLPIDQILLQGKYRYKDEQLTNLIAELDNETQQIDADQFSKEAEVPNQPIYKQNSLAFLKHVNELRSKFMKRQIVNVD